MYVKLTTEEFEVLANGDFLSDELREKVHAALFNGKTYEPLEDILLEGLSS